MTTPLSAMINVTIYILDYELLISYTFVYIDKLPYYTLYYIHHYCLLYVYDIINTCIIWETLVNYKHIITI